MRSSTQACIPQLSGSVLHALLCISAVPHAYLHPQLSHGSLQLQSGLAIFLEPCLQSRNLLSLGSHLQARTHIQGDF